MAYVIARMLAASRQSRGFLAGLHQPGQDRRGRPLRRRRHRGRPRREHLLPRPRGYEPLIVLAGAEWPPIAGSYFTQPAPPILFRAGRRRRRQPPGPPASTCTRPTEVRPAVLPRPVQGKSTFPPTKTRIPPSRSRPGSPPTSWTVTWRAKTQSAATAMRHDGHVAGGGHPCPREPAPALRPRPGPSAIRRRGPDRPGGGLRQWIACRMLDAGHPLRPRTAVRRGPGRDMGRIGSESSCRFSASRRVRRDVLGDWRDQPGLGVGETHRKCAPWMSGLAAAAALESARRLSGPGAWRSAPSRSHAARCLAGLRGGRATVRSQAAAPLAGWLGRLAGPSGRPGQTRAGGLGRAPGLGPRPPQAYRGRCAGLARGGADRLVRGRSGQRGRRSRAGWPRVGPARAAGVRAARSAGRKAGPDAVAPGPPLSREVAVAGSGGPAESCSAGWWHGGRVGERGFYSPAQTTTGQPVQIGATGRSLALGCQAVSVSGGRVLVP